MNKRKRLLLIQIIILGIFLMSLENLFAQNVTVNLDPAPPGKLGIAELWKVKLNNTSKENLRVYLYGTLTEKKAGLIATAKTTDIELKPGPKSIKASDFPTEPDVSYTSSDPKYKEALIKTGNVPPGEYTYCVFVRLKSNNEELGTDCQESNPGDLDMLSLISPGDEDEINAKMTVVFTWMMGRPQQGLKYSLRVVELLKGQTPQGAMKQNKAFFEKSDISQTVFNYPNAAPKFIDGKKYTWQVKSKELESEIWTFFVGNGGEIQNVTVELISPIEKDTSIGFNPVFKFKANNLPSGTTFNLRVIQVEENEDPSLVINKKKPIIEEKGIREQFWKAPEKNLLFDTNMTYAWKIEAIGIDGLPIGNSRTAIFFTPSLFCMYLYPIFPTPPFCEGANILYPCLNVFKPGCSASKKWQWTIDGVPGPLTNSCTPYNISSLQPGTHTIKNMVRLSPCCNDYSYTRTFTILPSVQDADIVIPTNCPSPYNCTSIQNTSVCYNTEALLIVKGLVNETIPPPVKWWYRIKNCSSGSWTPYYEWSSGVKVFTNILGSLPSYNNNAPQFSCSSTSMCFKVQYKVEYGTVTPANSSCTMKELLPVTVYCPTNFSSITPIQNSYCVSAPPTYPGNSFPISITANPGQTVTWKFTNNTTNITQTIPNSSNLYTINFPNATFNPTLAVGSYTITATVQNGPITSGLCGPISKTCTINILPKLTGDINCDKTEICPNDRATLNLINLPNTPGLTIEWLYDKNCTGNWTSATIGTATSWNTNDMGLGWMYNIPLPSNPNADWCICWKAIIRNPALSGNTECAIYPTSSWKINIIKKPCIPTIICMGGWPPNCTKCAGSPIQLKANFPSGCNITNFTYQWSFNGLGISGATSQTYNAILPGNYNVTVYNKYKCDSVKATIPFEVKDCIFDMNISTDQTDCCIHPGQNVRFKVRDASGGSNFSSCGGSYTYQWYKNGTPIPNATNPDYSTIPFIGTPSACSTTVTYSVTIRDGKGCSKTKDITLLICP